jgi:hypothetical protein
VAASIADYRRSHRRTCPPPETAVVSPPLRPAEALPRSLVSMALDMLAELRDHKKQLWAARDTHRL